MKRYVFLQGFSESVIDRSLRSGLKSMHGKAHSVKTVSENPS